MMSRNSINKRDWLTVDKLINSMSIDSSRRGVTGSGTKVGSRGAGQEDVTAKVLPRNGDRNRKDSVSSAGIAQRGVQREEPSSNNRNKYSRSYEYEEDIEETGFDDDSTGYDEYEDTETGRGDRGRSGRRDSDGQGNPYPKTGGKALVPSHLNSAGSPNDDFTYYGNSRTRPTPPATAEEDRHLYEVKTFLQKMKAILLKRASDIRAHDRLPRGLFKHGQHTSALFEEISRFILLKDFEPHILKTSRGQNRNGVDFPSFCLVLKKYASVGTQPLSEVAARMLYTRCTDTKKGTQFQGQSDMGGADRDRDRGERGQNRADPSVLLDLVFCQGGVTLTEFGFTRLVPAASTTGRYSWLVSEISPRSTIGRCARILSMLITPINHLLNVFFFTFMSTLSFFLSILLSFFLSFLFSFFLTPPIHFASFSLRSTRGQSRSLQDAI